MNAIYFKVNGKGNYKQYCEVEDYVEFTKLSDELLARAAAKGFKRVSRKQPIYGVSYIYSDGKDKVEIVYISSDWGKAWLKSYDLQRKPENQNKWYVLGRDGNVYYNGVKVA